MSLLRPVGPTRWHVSATGRSQRVLEQRRPTSRLACLQRTFEPLTEATCVAWQPQHTLNEFYSRGAVLVRGGGRDLNARFGPLWCVLLAVRSGLPARCVFDLRVF